MERTGAPLQVELGPGIMDNIFDGIQRPLDAIAKLSGSVFVPRGVNVKSLDHTKIWEFVPADVKVGELVGGGFIFGTVQENRLINHRVRKHERTCSSVWSRVFSLVALGGFAYSFLVLPLN